MDANRVNAIGGEDIKDFCSRLQRRAARNGCHVVGIFNDVEIIATPSTSVDDLYEQWDLPQRRSYFGKSRKFRTLDN